MRFRYFYIERHEMDYWISPEAFGVNLIIESDDDEKLVSDIEAAYLLGDIEDMSWAKYHLYFDNAAARTAFMLRWGCGN